MTNNDVRVQNVQQIAEDIKHGNLFATKETVKEGYDWAKDYMIASGMSEFAAVTALAILCNTIAKKIEQATQ